MATGDFPDAYRVTLADGEYRLDAATLAWFKDSLPARTLSVEPGEIEFANDAPQPELDMVAGLILTRDSLLAAVESLTAESGVRRAQIEMLRAENASLRTAFMAEVDAWKAECVRLRDLALDPHDFGSAVETVELEIPDARDGIALTSASHPVPAFPDQVSGTVNGSPCALCAGGSRLAHWHHGSDANPTRFEPTAPDTVVDDPSVPQPIAGHGASLDDVLDAARSLAAATAARAPADPRAVALARAFKQL